MKISNKSEVLENRRAQLEGTKDGKNGVRQGSLAANERANDSVSVPLGKAIQETLESLSSRGDKQARVAEIKQMIQQGGAAAYFKQVPSEKVAKSFLEEISLEISGDRDSQPGERE